MQLWGAALLAAFLLGACGPEPLTQGETRAASQPSAQEAAGGDAGTPGLETQDSEAPSPGATGTRTAGALPQPRQVRVTQPQEDVLRSVRSASVTLEPFQEAQVAAAASGRVEAVLHRAGEVVEAGATVVQLETEALSLARDNARIALESARVNLAAAQSSSGEGLAQAEAGIRSAAFARNLARTQLEQAQALRAAGGIAQAEVAGLEAQLAQAEAAYAQAEAALARAGRVGGEDLELLRLQLAQAENGLAQAESALADASVSAPFAGEVTELFAEVGEFVGAGSPVFRLASSARQLARFSVPPEDAARLQADGLVQVRYGGLDYAAQIVRSAQPAGGGRLVELSAEVYPAESRIPTGAVATLEYEVELGRGLLLPSGALQTSGGESAVLVLERSPEGARVRRQPVRVVAEAGGTVALAPEAGLSLQSEVVYPLPADLRSGSSVLVVGAP